MATKLDLAVKVLLNQIEAGENKEEVLKTGMKSFTSDALNLNLLLKEKNVDPEIAREMMEQLGLDYSGKTRKFS